MRASLSESILAFVAIAAASTLLVVATSPGHAPAVRTHQAPENVSPAHDCSQLGHMYSPWFKSAKTIWSPEQPAHVCRFCGYRQTWAMRVRQLKYEGLPQEEAEAKAVAEINLELPNYESAPAIPRTK